VGIDLGTTYSSLAYMDEQLTPRVVADSSGQSVMPSVIFFDEEEVVVGDLALQQAKLNADRAVQFIKVHMGDNWRREIDGHVHTPESISAIILGQLLREATPQIGPIQTAVITVPAYFTEKRRRATQQAGEIAGLQVIGTLNEPMAATLAYGLHRTEREQIAVVYDLGGGTFDVTVVRITPGELQELATRGNRQLGGRDWDQVLVDHVANSFAQHHGASLLEDAQAMQDLRLECERAKRRLSRMAKTAIRVQAQGRDHAVDVTRQEFESLTAHLVRTTKLTTEVALEDAQLTWQQVSRVVLVGGSTHMPAVRAMLEQVSGKAPDIAVNPVIAVALGAAMYGYLLESGTELNAVRLQQPGEEKSRPAGVAETQEFQPAAETLANPPATGAAPGGSLPKVKFVTAHGVGVRVRKAKGHGNHVLVPQNSRVPISVTQRFQTVSKGGGGSQIQIVVTQGDTPDIDLCEVLGTGVIEGLPANERAGQPVDVTLGFDEQGRLHAQAVYVSTKQNLQLTIAVAGGLKEAEVEAQREYLSQAGMVPRFELEDDDLPPLESFEDDDEDDIPFLEPVE
jgi:molecular chaperone DnaK